MSKDQNELIESIREIADRLNNLGFKLFEEDKWGFFSQRGKEMSEADKLHAHYNMVHKLRYARLQFQQTNFQVGKMFHEAVYKAIEDYKTQASMLNPFKSGNPNDDDQYSAYKNDDRHEDLLIDLCQDIRWILETKMGNAHE